MLRRSITVSERDVLERRRSDLEPWVGGYHESEFDAVARALGEMYSGFPSTNGHSDEQAVIRVELMSRSLRTYPFWAIEKVCERVRLHGYPKKDRDRTTIERHWPPSDAEMIEMIEAEVKLYRAPHDAIVALLEANVTKEGT